jgi:hypothetical protein
VAPPFPMPSSDLPPAQAPDRPRTRSSPSPITRSPDIANEGQLRPHLPLAPFDYPTPLRIRAILT